MVDDQAGETKYRLRLRPGGEVLRISADLLQVILPNHNATFTGAEAVQPLGRILDLLEVSEGVDEIIGKVCAEFDKSEGFVRYLFQLLEQHGCTYRQGADERDEIESLEQRALKSYFAQSGITPLKGIEQLNAYAALLIVPDYLAGAAQAALDMAGLRRVRVQPILEGEDVTKFMEKLDLEFSTEPPVLLACYGLSYRSSLARLINETAVAHGISILFGVIDGMVGRVGPFVMPGDTACLECALERVLSNSTKSDVNALLAHRARTAGRVSFPPLPHPLFERAIFDFFLIELTQIALGRFSRSLGGLVEYTPTVGQSTHSKLLRTPRCPVCCPTTPQRMAWDARFSAPKVKAADA